MKLALWVKFPKKSAISTLQLNQGDEESRCHYGIWTQHSTCLQCSMPESETQHLESWNFRLKFIFTNWDNDDSSLSFADEDDLCSASFTKKIIFLSEYACILNIIYKSMNITQGSHFNSGPTFSASKDNWGMGGACALHTHMYTLVILPLLVACSQFSSVRNVTMYGVMSPAVSDIITIICAQSWKFLVTFFKTQNWFLKLIKRVMVRVRNQS